MARRLRARRAHQQVAAPLAAQVGHHGGGEADRQLDAVQVLLLRPLRLPEVQEHGHVAVAVLLELADQQGAVPGGGPPVDPAAAVAVLPGADAVEIALRAPRSTLAALRALKRLVVPRHPAPRQPPQARKDGQRAGRPEHQRAAKQPERKPAPHPHRSQAIAAALVQSPPIRPGLCLAGGDVGEVDGRVHGRRPSMVRDALDPLLGHHGPTAAAAPRVGQLDVYHQEVAGADFPGHLAADLQSPHGEDRQAPTEQYGPGHQPGEHQQQVDLPHHRPAEDEDQDDQVRPPFQAEGGPASARSCWVFVCQGIHAYPGTGISSTRRWRSASIASRWPPCR